MSDITNAEEYKQALALLEELIEFYDENLILIEVLSSVIARYEDESVLLKAFNNRQESINPDTAMLKVLMDQTSLGSPMNLYMLEIQ